MEVIRKIERHFLDNEKDAVESVFAVQGFSFGGSGQNTGIAFVSLKDWSERTAPHLAASAVAGSSASPEATTSTSRTTSDSATRR